jgi:ribosomal protein L11 methyltransferase
VVANITVSALLELRGRMAAHVVPDGLAVLSGVLEERAGDLRQAYEADGWQHVRTDQAEDWVAMTLQAPC